VVVVPADNTFPAEVGSRSLVGLAVAIGSSLVDVVMGCHSSLLLARRAVDHCSMAVRCLVEASLGTRDLRRSGPAAVVGDKRVVGPRERHIYSTL